MDLRKPSFADFLKLVEAYQIYQQTMQQPVQTVQQPVQTVQPVQEAAQPMQPVQEVQKPDLTNELMKRLEALEKRQMTPSITNVESKGLEDVFNRMLSD